MKELIIVTGPSGAGKSTWIATHFPDYALYDQNSQNKADWRDHKASAGPAVLVTAAPTNKNKVYWLDLARRFGFSPRLYVIDPGIGRTVQQLHRREKGSDARRRRLTQSVQRWYNSYSPHDEEIKIDGRSGVSEAS